MFYNVYNKINYGNDKEYNKYNVKSTYINRSFKYNNCKKYRPTTWSYFPVTIMPMIIFKGLRNKPLKLQV